METSLGALRFPCFLLLICVHHPLARADDTVSRDRPLSGGRRLVSSGGNFALGFFQPALILNET
uniref:Uncharacterized protein n=1 Tax=Oryza punctata TaxID=4537 RepID=A0A0E0JLN7_ORYPU